MSDKKHTLQRILIGIFAGAGLGIMTYLTVIHYTAKQSFCDISEKVSCDVVTTSIYSEIFGVPVSLLGMLFFGFVLFLIFTHENKRVFQNLFFITLFFLIPSLYLSLMELLVIKAFCILCESSKVLMIAILITAFSVYKQEGKFKFRMIVPVVIAGVVMAAVTFFAQTGTVVQRDYSELVACMNENDVVYYKSVRCNNCKRQEKLLGDAYLKMNQVECHPDGEDSQPELCLEKDIDKTPTFTIEADGVEVDPSNRLVGLQSIEKLAEYAGCPVPQE